MKYAYGDNNKQIFLVKLKKTLYTKIAVNDPYDSRLCGSNTV